MADTNAISLRRNALIEEAAIKKQCLKIVKYCEMSMFASHQIISKENANNQKHLLALITAQL